MSTWRSKWSYTDRAPGWPRHVDVDAADEAGGAGVDAAEGMPGAGDAVAMPIATSAESAMMTGARRGGRDDDSGG